MPKIIFSLRILRSWFLLAHFLINSSALLWLRRLVSRRSIPILTRQLLFLFLLSLPLFLQVSPVSASLLRQVTDTVTATPTFRALFPTQTAEPTQDYSCPAGVPAGWGTVTPNAYWSLQCGSCSPSQVYPTGTPFPVSTFFIPVSQTAAASLGTPVPSTPGTSVPSTPGTPVPSTPGTPVPSTPGTPVLFSCSSVSIPGATCSQINPYSVKIFFGGGGSSFALPIVFSSSASVVKVYYSANYLLHYEIGYGQRPADDGLIFSGFALDDGSNSPIVQFMGGYSNEWVGWGWVGDKTVVQSGEFLLSSDMVTKFMSGGIDGRIYMSYPSGGEIVLSADALTFLTPTPIPSTPIPSFCSSVQSGDDSSSLGGSFSLPVPLLGAEFCPVDFERRVLSMGGVLSIPDIHVPGVHLCFQEVDFGKMNYYGTELDINGLAFILAAAAIVRMFTKH